VLEYAARPQFERESEGCSREHERDQGEGTETAPRSRRSKCPRGRPGSTIGKRRSIT
jgi:hypothetical protein